MLYTPAVDYSRRTFSHKPWAYYTPAVLQDICATSHTVGDNKLCAIYLIYRLDHLNYVMGSQLQRMVFELLELLSAVNMQL